jgi:hypothetical protein
MPAMATVQLNVRVDAALAARLKAEAKRRHALPGSLVAQALEQFLSNAGEPLAKASGGWQKPLAALEARVAKLETKPAAPPAAKASPEQAKPDPPVEPAKIPQVGDDAITTADLAIATGTNRKAWNNWARDKNAGAIRKMNPEVGNWRYLGKAPSEMGGPERRLWEPA